MSLTSTIPNKPNIHNGRGRRVTCTLLRLGLRIAATSVGHYLFELDPDLVNDWLRSRC